MIVTNWEEIGLKVLTVIQVCLSNDVFEKRYQGGHFKGAWKELESLYMTKNDPSRFVLEEFYI